jgi:hypothetical protein
VLPFYATVGSSGLTIVQRATHPTFAIIHKDFAKRAIIGIYLCIYGFFSLIALPMLNACIKGFNNTVLRDFLSHFATSK